MRWELGRRSTNIEDRRGLGLGGGGVVLGGGTLLLLALFAALTGVDPTVILQGIEQSRLPASDEAPAHGVPAGDEQADFVAAVLGDTEDTWHAIFAESGSRYRPPTLVLFSDAVESACGLGSAAVGPFYCPPDERVYIDLAFFHDLAARFGAPGDFARAYVIAHEVGHHVQRLLGISDRMRDGSAGRENATSVRIELQADCLAGVWGHHANRDRALLEPGDVEEGLAAAAAIGDDRLQRRAGGTVQPESWTHGSSAQRVRWLRRGLTTGRVEDCDTFEGGAP